MLSDRLRRGGERAKRELVGETECRVEMLADREDRFVAAYSTAGRSLVGKFYPGAQGEATLEILRALRDRLDSARAGRVLAVPRAVSYESDLRCLLQTRARGLPYTSQDDEPTRASFLRLAGRALAEVHALPCLPRPAKTMRDHIAELIRPDPRTLIRHVPEFAGEILRALGRIEQLEQGWTDLPTVVIHRDFQLRQLLRDGNRMWVLDWDLAANGDPAFDVAYFIVYLKNHLQPSSLDRAVRSFVDGYAPGGQPGLLERLEAYEIFNYLRRACRRFRLRDRDWEPEMRRMLHRMVTARADVSSPL